MDKKKLVIAASVSAGIGTATYSIKKSIDKKAGKLDVRNGKVIRKHTQRKQSFYEKHIKRGLDIFCSILAFVCFGWLYIIVAILVRAKLGSPVLFKQLRPGMIDPKIGKERIFKMYKFRSMTDERDENGELLPDEVRLTSFGKWLRSTSLDELPEFYNILKGDMSLVGPRPLLVKDMLFMTDEQRLRHTIRPGLSGLAQINGRNDIVWEDKLNWDLKYIEHITILSDIKIIIQTVIKAFLKQEGITERDMATAEDFGDYLLHRSKINKKEYDEKQAEAKKVLGIPNVVCDKDLVSIVMPSYNTAQYIKEAIQSVLDQTYTNWELLIVDDCSTDETDEILSSLHDDRIKRYRNKRNSGVAVSRNRALKEAKGRWIAFLDSDDLWYPQKLEKQISFMEKNGYSFTYTNYEEIDTNGKTMGIKVTGPKRITKTSMIDYCWPGCLTVMYDVEKIGIIQIADIKKNNDYAMWLKACQKADCYLLDEYLAKYRKGRVGSVSTHSIRTMIGWHYKLFREAEGECIVISLLNTCRNMAFGIYKKNKYVKR